MATDYDNTITVAGPVEDLKAIYEELIVAYGSENVEFSGNRVTCKQTSRNQPAFGVSEDLSKKYRRVTVAHSFWAEYAECHGYRIYVVGTSEYEHVEDGIPCQTGDATDEDAAALLIQERYESEIEARLRQAAK